MATVLVQLKHHVDPAIVGSNCPTPRSRISRPIQTLNLCRFCQCQLCHPVFLSFHTVFVPMDKWRLQAQAKEKISPKPLSTRGPEVSQWPGSQAEPSGKQEICPICPCLALSPCFSMFLFLFFKRAMNACSKDLSDLCPPCHKISQNTEALWQLRQKS